MGSVRRWLQPPSSAFRLEHAGRRMLRQLDAGRALFRLPVYPQSCNPYLGYAGAEWPSPAGQSRAGSVDLRSDELLYASAEPGWQKAFRRRGTETRRTCSIRYEGATVGQLPVRDLGGAPGFFQGWRVGGLCDLPRGKFVAEQSGWQGAGTTHLPPVASQLATLVSRWETDCIHCQGAWEILEDLSDIGRGRKPPETDARGGRRI